VLATKIYLSDPPSAKTANIWKSESEYRPGHFDSRTGLDDAVTGPGFIEVKFFFLALKLALRCRDHAFVRAPVIRAKHRCAASEQGMRLLVKCMVNAGVCAGRVVMGNFFVLAVDRGPQLRAD
jgi:hypothetical protein